MVPLLPCRLYYAPFCKKKHLGLWERREKYTIQKLCLTTDPISAHQQSDVCICIWLDAFWHSITCVPQICWETGCNSNFMQTVYKYLCICIWILFDRALPRSLRAARRGRVWWSAASSHVCQTNGGSSEPEMKQSRRPEYNLFIEFSLCPTLTSDWPVSLRCASAQSLIWNVDSLLRSKYQTLFALLSKVDWWNENPLFMGIQLYSCARRHSKPRSNSNMLLHLESLLFTVCSIWKIKWAVSTFGLCLLYLGGGGVWKGCKIHLAGCLLPLTRIYCPPLGA